MMTDKAIQNHAYPKAQANDALAEQIGQAVQSVMAKMEQENKERQTITNGAAVRNGQGCKKMTLKMAEALIAKVKQKAALMGVNAVVAVFDASARPVAVHCMDDAFIASFDIALNKAYTCASLKMSTSQLGELSQPGQPLYGIQFTNGGKIVIFGGGEVLKIQGNIIGALGVSGGSAQEDTALAAYGKAIFEEVTACL